MFEYSLQVNHISFPKDYSDCAEGECLVLTDFLFRHFLLLFGLYCVYNYLVIFHSRIIIYSIKIIKQHDFTNV